MMASQRLPGTQPRCGAHQRYTSTMHFDKASCSPGGFIASPRGRRASQPQACNWIIVLDFLCCCRPARCWELACLASTHPFLPGGCRCLNGQPAMHAQRACGRTTLVQINPC